MIRVTEGGTAIRDREASPSIEVTLGCRRPAAHLIRNSSCTVEVGPKVVSVASRVDVRLITSTPGTLISDTLTFAAHAKTLGKVAKRWRDYGSEDSRIVVEPHYLVIRRGVCIHLETASAHARCRTLAAPTVSVFACHSLFDAAARIDVMRLRRLTVSCTIAVVERDGVWTVGVESA